MAGGEGSRLRPLTCDCPKPLLRLLDRPLMEYAIELLKRHGIKDIGVTLGYLPDEIQEYFGDGSRFGVSLRYYTEHTPLGTAGSILQARDFLDERFFVLSGDGVTDFDLTAALCFHENRDAMATLLLHRCPNPQEYGMVVTDGEGRIRSFHEKPGICDVFSDRINTGIYILEPEILNYIPDGQPYDFGRELFPALLAADQPVYGFTAEGYWCDVGDVAAYLRVHADAMDGKIGLACNASVSDGAILEPGCHLEMPCSIAPGARICAGAAVGPCAVVGTDCIIHPGASVKHSILFDRVQAEAGAQLRGCIAASGVQIGENAQLYEESVIGSGSRIGARAVLAPGVKLWPGKSLPDGEHPEENIVWGARREQRFIRGALQLDGPAHANRAAEAICAELKPKELLVGRTGSTVAAAMWHAACAGMLAQGVRILDAGVCSLPQLRHSLSSLRCDGAMLVDGHSLLPLTPSGAYLAERRQRAILKLAERQDFPAPFSGITHPVSALGRTDLPYIAAAATHFTADPCIAPQLLLACENRHVLSLAQSAFQRAGLSVRCEWNPQRLRPDRNALAFILSGSGEEAVPADCDGRLDETQCQLARAWTMLEGGARRLILPLHATRGIEALARKYNAQLLYPSGETAAWMNAAAEREPLQFALHCDGIAFALAFLSRLTEHGLSLVQWRDRLPDVYRSTRKLHMPSSQRSRVLRTLAEENPHAEIGGGLRLPMDRGWAWLSPDEAGGEMQLMAEASTMEAADELCAFIEGKLRRLLEKQD